MVWELYELSAHLLLLITKLFLFVVFVLKTRLLFTLAELHSAEPHVAILTNFLVQNAIEKTM